MAFAAGAATLLLLAVLLGGVGDGGAPSSSSVGYGGSVGGSVRLDSPLLDGKALTHANDSFTRGWATFVPTATPTASATPAAGTTGRTSALAYSGSASQSPSGRDVALICAYPWPCGWALAVSFGCEVVGSTHPWTQWDHKTGATYYGPWQIAVSHGFDLSTPAKQVAAAWRLYSTGGAGHWPNCP